MENLLNEDLFFLINFLKFLERYMSLIQTREKKNEKETKKRKCTHAAAAQELMLSHPSRQHPT